MQALGLQSGGSDVMMTSNRAANAASVNILLNFLTLSSVLHLHWMHFFPKQWGFATGAGSEQTAKEIAEISLLRAEVGKLSTQVELQRQGL